MTELSSELKKHLSEFQKICTKFSNNERNNKELTSMLRNLQHTNEILKENDKKSAEQIKLLRQICNEQVNAIAGLHDLKTKNKLLSKENASLQDLIQKLKDTIEAIEIRNNETMQGYIFKHKVELDDKNEQFNIREKELQEKIEVLQASFDLEIYEKDNEKKSLKINCDEQLKKATDKEQQLKNEIYKLNNQLSSSTAVLQKKILELEQKLKTSEREKSMFNISQGNFISANNVFRNFSNVTQINRNDNSNNSENHTHNRNSIIRNVSENIENNTAKKFQFRKSNRPLSKNVEKRLLNESFNPFEMNKQMNANNPHWKQNDSSNEHEQMIATNTPNRDVTYDIIEDNSENSNNLIQEYRLEETKNTEHSIIDDKDKEVKIVGQQQKNNMKRVSPSLSNKKRRLFNPKNMDYLN